MQAIKRAIEAMGGQTALARALDVSQPTVFDWLNERRKVPAVHCAAIERLTNKAVLRTELRPDDWRRYWPELDAKPYKRTAKA